MRLLDSGDRVAGGDHLTPLQVPEPLQVSLYFAHSGDQVLKCRGHSPWSQELS